jgi:hypothetical protein
VEKGADKIYPAYKELERRAAQGDLVHNDDATNKILDLIKDNKTKTEKERTEIFTTGIVSIYELDPYLQSDERQSFRLPGRLQSYPSAVFKNSNQSVAVQYNHEQRRIYLLLRNYLS